jgi:hypothetical protein
MQFQVPAEMYPGVARHELGLVRVGEIFEWPNKMSLKSKPYRDLPPLRLRPLDDEAYKALVKAYGKEKVKDEHGDGPVAPIIDGKAPVLPQMSPAEFNDGGDVHAGESGGGDTKKRASDSE